jgi:2-dehydropantoate 2-reductase
MRYIIYGAGAIGGTIGACLHRSGADVLLIARGTHFDRLAADGLTYRSPNISETLQIPVVDHPAKITFRADDVLLLTMKSQHTEAALETLATLAPPDLAIICAQNGVANEAMAARKFRQVYGMLVLHHASGIGGVLDVGRYQTGVDSCIQQVAEDVTRAGFLCAADPRPMRWKYAKLLQNLGNAFQAVCSPGPQDRDVMSLVRQEALACYAAANIDCATQAEVKTRHSVITMGSIDGIEHGGGSSWQSLSRGTGDIEADYLNGEICLLGQQQGVPTPANEVLRYLANQAAFHRTPPGQFNATQIAAMIADLAA